MAINKINKSSFSAISKIMNKSKDLVKKIGGSETGLPDLTVSSNMSLDSTEDGDMVRKSYNNVTINSGCTLTVSNRCKGLVLHVDGNLVVNGTITMTARGAYAACPSDVVITDPYTNVELCTIPAVGGAGATNRNGGVGTDGTGRQTGGGGAGGSFQNYGGVGADGTAYSGGSGGGGAMQASASGGTANGGPGGNAAYGGGTSYGQGGGAGNPGGNGSNGGGAGDPGTGGLLVINVKGNITIGASGKINSNGSNGGAGNEGGGGASGGGSVNIFYKGTYTNSGSVTASGGTGYVGAYRPGGNGGNGRVTLTQL